MPLKVQLAGACAIAAIVASGAAQAADYYLLAANPNQIALIDLEAITAGPDGQPAAPVVFIRRAPQTNGIRFAYDVIQSEFDCSHRKAAAEGMTLFDADGRPSANQVPPPATPTWMDVQPDSQAEAALNLVCAKPEARGAIAFRMKGLPLDKIVTSVFDGSWPYDDVLARRQAAPKPQ